MSERSPELFARLGPHALRAVLADFYDRVFADVMIGFLFAGKDKQRLIDKEWELTARMLGAPVAYTGRPMRMAHAGSPIFGGHFERRLQILRETLADHAVDPDVVRVWLEHQRALRPQITNDRGSDCEDAGVPADFAGLDAPAAPAPTIAPPELPVTAPATERTLVRLGRKPPQ